MSFFHLDAQYYFCIITQEKGNPTYYTYNEAAATLFARNNIALCLALEKGDDTYRTYLSKLINALHRPDVEFKTKSEADTPPESLTHVQALLEINNQIILNQANDRSALNTDEQLSSLCSIQQLKKSGEIQKNLQNIHSGLKSQTTKKIHDIFHHDHTKTSILKNNILPKAAIGAAVGVIVSVVAAGLLTLYGLAIYGSPPLDLLLKFFVKMAGAASCGAVPTGAALGGAIFGLFKDDATTAKYSKELCESTLGFFKQQKSVNPPPSAPPLSDDRYNSNLFPTAEHPI